MSCDVIIFKDEKINFLKKSLTQCVDLYHNNYVSIINAETKDKIHKCFDNMTYIVDVAADIQKEIYLTGGNL